MIGVEKNKMKQSKVENKLKKYAGRIGEKTAYYSLLLFYATKSPNVPRSAKLIVLGALMYLVFPIDLIPDFIPVIGVADDATVIAGAVYKIFTHIDDEIREKAKARVSKIFGKVTTDV